MTTEVKDGGPAFPSLDSLEGYGQRDSDAPAFTAYGSGGMSLRDYFAAQALIALGSHKAVTNRGIEWLAQHAYMVADAMLQEREK